MTPEAATSTLWALLNVTHAVGISTADVNGTTWHTARGSPGITVARAVIGVAADIKYVRINEPPRPYVYVPLLQSYLDGVTADVMRHTFETNVFGTVRVTHAFLPLLQRSPAPVVVNVSSGLASLTRVTTPDTPAYAYPGVAYPASKTAVNTTVDTINAGTEVYYQIDVELPDLFGLARPVIQRMTDRELDNAHQLLKAWIGRWMRRDYTARRSPLRAFVVKRARAANKSRFFCIPMCS